MNLCDATQTSHNDDECETPANTTTHCGTCTARASPAGVRHQRIACAVHAGNTSAYCSYTCNNTNCPTTAHAAATARPARSPATAASPTAKPITPTTPTAASVLAPARHRREPSAAAAPPPPTSARSRTRRGLAPSTGTTARHARQLTTSIPAMKALAACTRHNGGVGTSCAQFTCHLAAPAHRCDRAGRSAADLRQQRRGHFACGNCWDRQLDTVFDPRRPNLSGHVNTSCGCARRRLAELAIGRSLTRLRRADNLEDGGTSTASASIDPER